MRADHRVDPSLPTSPTSFSSAHEHLPSGEAAAILKRLEDSPVIDNGVTRSRDTTTALSSEECSAPGIPNRTSSNPQTQSVTSAPAQGVVSEPKTVSKKGSKDSIKEKRRSGSLGSIGRSKENLNTAGLAEQEKAGPSLQAVSGSEKPKKRGVPRFLSLLGCCGAQDDAKNADVSEPAVPPKKAKVLQAKSGRQPTPAVKTEKSAAESSTGESKEMPEETIGGTPYSEQTAAAKPKMVTRRSKENAPTEKSAGLGNGHTSEKEPPNPINTGDQPLPPLPASGLLANQSPATAEPSPGPDVVSVLPPNPPVTASAEEDVEEEGQVINDRTPEQAKRDSDIEMTQAPPIAPEAGDSQRTTEPEEEQQQIQASLPPPPPRNNQNRGSSPAGRSPAAERQQWLLPPIQPRFQGKKCLVLDLDETLVHSSFKVNTNHDRAFSLELTALDSSPSRLYNPCGNRGPIPQRLCHQATRRRSVHETSWRALRSRCFYCLRVQGNSWYP